ncbi:hypothetical protein D3OALGB2SA_4008 [Olavius algarvensis associated proteobacterium Delta 3]|nr:hypothetical protein D3OALGB2SA_4008 [Olavius algarvensis associated proteobacterium Delta 3]
MDVRYEYDSVGNLIQVSRDKRVEKYTYTPGFDDSGHNMLSYTDPNGNVTTYKYLADTGKAIFSYPGLPAAFGIRADEFVNKVIEPGGRTGGNAFSTTTFTYNISTTPGTPNKRIVQDPRPIPPTVYTLNDYGATVKIEAPLGKVTTMEWATPDSPKPNSIPGSGIDIQLVSQTDSLGLHRAYKYDELGNLTQETVTFTGGSDPFHVPVVDASGSAVNQIVTTYTYDPLFSKTTSKTDAEGNSAYYVYDSPTGVAAGVSYPAPTGRTGNMVAVINAAGETTKFAYDTKGDLLTQTDPRGKVTKYTAYDPYGNATQIMDPEGNMTTRAFDARGRLLTQTDTFGHRVEYAYDTLDRKIRETRYDDLFNQAPEQTTYQYKPGGEVITMTDGLGQETSYQYDTGNRPVTSTEKGVTAADGSTTDLITRYAYDENGNIIQETDPRSVVRTFIFDALNRNTKIELTVGQALETWQLGYDTEDNQLFAIDNFANKTEYIYDRLHRPVKTILPFPNAVVETRYNLVGNKVRETDANGNPMTYSYDKVYRLKKETDALDNSVEYTYDKSGNVVKAEHRTGSQFTYEVTYDNGVEIQDGLGRPTKVNQKVFGDPTDSNTSPVVYTTTTLYDDTQNRIVITDPRGFEIEELRDGLDRVRQRSQDPQGLNLTTVYSYDGNGNLKTIQDPQNGDKDVEYTYDGLNRMIRADYQQGYFETYFYDGVGNLIKQTDRRGIVFQTDYDELNRPIEERVREDISGGGQWLATAVYTYDDANLKVTIEDAKGNPTVHQYDKLGRVESTTDALSHTDYFIYDGVNLIERIDRLGRHTMYDYDDLNRLILTEEGDPTTTRTTMSVDYQDDRNRVITTDRRGIETIVQNDSLGRRVRVSRKDPGLAADYGTTQIVLLETEYDGNSNKTFVRDAEGNETKFLYDGANRQVEMITGFGSSVEATTKYTYDDVGNLLTVKDARATGATADMTYTYDALYRWTKAVDGEGNATLYTSYDGSNNLLSMTEPAGPDHTTTYTYDEFNTLLSVDETRGGAGGVTSYLYDANRNRVAQQDANGNLVTYAYDVLNRLTDTYQHLTPGQITATTQAGSNPGGSLSTALHTHYDYDDVGNQTLIVDPEGQRVDLAYDYLDRLEKRVYSNHVDPDLDYQPHSIAYGYDDNSNLISVIEVKRVDGANVTESYIYDYDQLDRLVEAKNYDGKIISYTYDKQGNRLSVTDPDGITTTYTYDERNRLDTATTEAGTTTYAYFPDSLLKSIAYPNGTVASYPSYDRADRLLSIVNHDGASQALSSYQYSYDANSNRKSQVETQYDINGGMPETTTYEYDRLNRLTRVTYGATGLGGDVSYTYSKNGNRLTEKGTDPTDPSQSFDRTYAYDRVNRLWSVTDNVNQSQSLAFTYDANGNRISKAAGAVNTSYDANGNPLVVVVSPSVTIPYAYSIRDQLVATTDGNGSPVKFDYDHARMRVKKIDAAGETRYLYDDRSTLLEYDTAGQTRIKYDYGDRLLSRVDVDPGPSGPTRTSQFYACDGLNSVVNLTADTGALQVSYQYDAWGNFRQMVGSSDNPKTYTGHEYDPETGLYYFKARYYDSDIGAFISQDSYLGQVDNPPSLHRYLYAHANPLTYVDPTGYEAESNRQLMGLDEKSYRETLEKGGFLSNVGLIFKDIGYNLWDAATVGFIPYIFTQKGFVSKHDRIFEAREKGKISDLEYWSGTVGHASLSLLEAATAGVGGGAAAAKIGVKAGLSVAWSGLKTAGAHTVKQGIAGAAKGGLVGAAIGAGLNAAEQGIDIGAGMRQQFNAAEFGQAAKWGLVFGAGIGGVAGGAKGILMDSYAARARATAASAAESGAIFGQAAQPAVTSGEAPTPRVVGENPASPSFGARNALPPSELPTSPRGRGGGGGRGGDPSETLQSAFELTQPIAVKAGEFTPGNVRDQLSRLNFEIAYRKKALALAEEKGGWANRDTTDPTLTQANPTRRLVNDQIVMDEALVKKAEQRSLYDFGKESDFRPMSGVDAVRVETIHEKFHAMIDYLESIGFPIVENKKALIVVALETELRNIAGLSRNLAKLVGSVWQEPDPVSAGDASIIALLSPDTIPTTALATWSGLVSGLAPFTLTLAFEDLPGSQLGETHTTTLDPSGNPSAGTIILDTNAAGVGWFVDPTPFDTSELSLVLDDTAFQAAPGSPAADKYDLLTVLLHEIGHLAGSTPYLAGFASHVETIGDTQQFVTPDFGATLSPDGEHLDGNKYPNDLMGAELTPSIRRLPSQLDAQIISAARGITPPSGQSSPISSADSTDSTIDDSDLTHAQAVWTTGDWPQFDEALMAEGYVEGELSNELLETDRIAAITGDAVAHWKTVNIVDEHSLNLQNVRLEISDLPDQTLARTRANLITLDDNAAGHGWFIDKTPWDDNEFQNVIYDWEMRANANSPAVGKIDLLTVLMHEMGHIMGLPDVPAGIDPSRLMTGILPAGVRRLPSSLDLAQGTGAGESREVLNQGTYNEDDLSIGITNGTFTIDDPANPGFAWELRGSSAIENGQGVLVEDDHLFSGLCQTFIVPDGAQTLLFAVVGIDLGSSTGQPPDAFEAALIDAETQTSLVGTAVGLTDTDAFLNIQADGSTYAGTLVSVPGLGNSGDVLSWSEPVLIAVDLSGVPGGTVATLCFDLLGFGHIDSSVVLDNAVIIGEGPVPPIAADDHAEERVGKAVEIDVLANDFDFDGTIDPTTVQIVPDSGPEQGVVTVDEQTGTVTYTPSDDFVGPDTFRYTVRDNDGYESNAVLVTVTKDLSNLPPTIAAEHAAVTVEEAQTAANTGTFADVNGDDVTITASVGTITQDDAAGTWSWTFDTTDGPDASQTVTITATDSSDAFTETTFELVVNNAVPVVDAGADETIDEGSTFSRSGSFSDPGADTWTATVDYGDDTGVQPLPLNQDGAFDLSHFYIEDGLYAVTVTVTDDDDGVGTDTVEVTVEDLGPTAAFTWSPEPQTEGSAVAFTDESTSSPDAIVSWSWDFGGLGSSTEQSPAFTFIDNGTYAVTLTVTDDDGSTDTVAHDVTITDLGPTAAFSWSPEPQAEGSEVAFVDESTSSPDAIVAWSWDFGGLGSSNFQNPEFTFIDNGIYSVSLTVADDDGSTNTVTSDITVTDIGPTAAFTWSPEPQAEGSAVAFADESTSSPDAIVAWTWDFGGLGYSTEQSPVFTFMDDGIYAVTLTVTDDDGSTDTVASDITITDLGPTAAFTWSPEPQAEGSAVAFADESTSSPDAIVAWSWDFGGRGSSSEPDPAFTFLDDGTYAVTLTITDDDGSTDTVTSDITITDLGPTAAFTWSPEPQAEGAAVGFSDQSTSSPDAIVAWSWDFGGLGISTDPDPVFTFLDDGIYAVTLTVTDDDGSISNASVTVNLINVAPDVSADNASVTVEEGQTATNTGTFFDPGEDIVIITASVGTITQDDAAGTWS